MKALIQRVTNAKVTVDGEIISSIQQGICVFIGICKSDTKKDLEYIVRKLLNIRFFNDASGNRWKKTVMDCQFEILCVSQFTLYNTWKGNKPDFHNAMPADKSKEFYENFLQMLRDAYIPEKVKDGKFSAYMQVSLQNDGPVTFEVESPTKVSCTGDTSNSKTNSVKEFTNRNEENVEDR